MLPEDYKNVIDELGLDPNDFGIKTEKDPEIQKWADEYNIPYSKAVEIIESRKRGQ